MSSFVTTACGNCVYYAMWHRFPPTASWVFIIPAWFLVLSLVRTGTGKTLQAIPRIYVAIPLVLAVFLLAPGAIGPPLGFWIPLCCIIGTYAGIKEHWKSSLARTLTAVLACTSMSLVAFGAYNWQQYDQLPTAEKEKLRPGRETMRSRKKAATPLDPYDRISLTGAWSSTPVSR